MQTHTISSVTRCNCSYRLLLMATPSIVTSSPYASRPISPSLHAITSYCCMSPLISVGFIPALSSHSYVAVMYYVHHIIRYRNMRMDCDTA